MTTRSIPLVATAPEFGGLRGLIDRLLDADRRYRSARHLRGLPEHMLEDIGLTRGEADLLSRNA